MKQGRKLVGGSMMEEDTRIVDSLVGEYAKIDRLAATILEDKQQIIALDSRQNKTREALRQLKTTHKDDKAWMCFGNTFIKVDTMTCKELLQRDKDTLESEINTLRDGLKPKVKELHNLEGSAEVKGFELKGMRVDEMQNISNPR